MKRPGLMALGVGLGLILMGQAQDPVGNTSTSNATTMNVVSFDAGSGAVNGSLQSVFNQAGGIDAGQVRVMGLGVRTNAELASMDAGTSNITALGVLTKLDTPYLDAGTICVDSSICMVKSSAAQISFRNPAGTENVTIRAKAFGGGSNPIVISPQQAQATAANPSIFLQYNHSDNGTSSLPAPGIVISGQTSSWTTRHDNVQVANGTDGNGVNGWRLWGVDGRGLFGLENSITLPTCVRILEGMHALDATGGDLVDGGSATSKVTKECMCTSDGAASPTYKWRNILKPTDTTGTTTACPDT